MPRLSNLTITTLLYCFNSQDETLLLHRTREPNRGLWSPCGGKVMTELGESPHAAATREAREEAGLQLQPSDLHLCGLVTETSPEGQPHWLMFLFEVRPRLADLPPPHEEGTFAFVPRDRLATLPLPRIDREQLWPLFWQYRGGFFAAHCRSHPQGEDEWTIEEARYA